MSTGPVFGETLTWAGESEWLQSITAEQRQARVFGLPWHRVGNEAVICTA